MDNTITLQGNFVSTGANVNLNIPCGVDWVRVYNFDAAGQTDESLPFEFYWQDGMPQGSGIVWVNAQLSGGTPVQVSDILVGGGFVKFDQGLTSGISSQDANSSQVSSPVLFTAVSNATQPVITTGSTAGLNVGDVVRLSGSTGAGNFTAADLYSIDFEIDTIVSNASFRIKNPLEQAPGVIVVGANNNWRKVTVGNTFYPELRYIVNIDTAGSVGLLNATALLPVITTSVDSGYLVGQEVTFHVSSIINGMVQINNLSAPIVAIDPAHPEAFQVSLDTTGFSAFVFPTAAAVVAIIGAYTPAHVVPAGMNTSIALASIPVVDILSDATVNQLIRGVTLLGGNPAADSAAGPAGALGDRMFWQAGAVYSNNGM